MLSIGALAFALGIWFRGESVIRTVGDKLTQLHPHNAFATQIAGALAVLLFTKMGMPISTSHCTIGSVVGVSLTKKWLG